MADNNSQSFEALEEIPTKQDEEEDRHSQHDEPQLGCGRESRGSESEPSGELRTSQSETLILHSPSELLPLKDRSDCVQVNSTSNFSDRAQSQETVLTAAKVHEVNAQTENRNQLTKCLALSELSPTSVTQPISSASSPPPIDNGLSPTAYNGSCKPKGNQRNSLAVKNITPTSIVKVSSSDGYNWRKYGQKQVKTPQGSRSYYRCTYAECYAKKIEWSDYSGGVTETVYKSQHTHDPPKKSSSAREIKLSSTERVSGNDAAKQSCGVPEELDPSSLVKLSADETSHGPDRKRQNIGNTDENGATVVKYEHVNEPEPKRRLKKCNVDYSGSLLKPSKKPKFVVHAASDVGISADGHRWRKYGQKMVKGNPNPRNYYRCTSAGCPVRKHIETAVDNTDTVIITYKGVHDHDTPVPKKRHGPPSAPLVAAAAPVSMNNVQLKKPETPTQWSVDKEGELTGEAMDLVGDNKAMESARTLLSIGFEIKPC